MDTGNQKPTSPGKIAKDYLLSRIRRIAAGANVELSIETVAAYAAELATLTKEQLDAAVSRTVREWDKPAMMPPVAFILARSGESPKLMAEQAWELAWKLVKKDWYADGIGWVAGAQAKLTPAIQYAIRQCGGEYRMAYSDEEAFPFIRRDFLAAHERFALEGGEQVRLTQGEAKNVFESLKRGELPEGWKVQ